MSSSSIQSDLFITNEGIIPISSKPRSSLNSTNSLVGNKSHLQAQSINSYSTTSAPSFDTIPSLPPPNSSKTETLPSISTTTSISSNLFNSIATSSRTLKLNTTQSLPLNTSSLNNLYSSNTNSNATNSSSHFNSISSLNSNNTFNMNKNMNAIPPQPIFNTGSILQPINSSNKSGLSNNNNSGTNPKISKGDLTMFDPYS